jgi:stalled ribosome rescue protein Dom34
MPKQVGLWIDHKKSLMVILDQEQEVIQEIESGIGKHTRYRGATHPKTPFSSQYQQGDDQLDNQYTERLNKFYKDVISKMRGADSALIFGPGEAKSELEKRLTHERVRVRNVRIECADKMTDRQIAAKVRKYFQQ